MTVEVDVNRAIFRSVATASAEELFRQPVRVRKEALNVIGAVDQLGFICQADVGTLLEWLGIGATTPEDPDPSPSPTEWPIRLIVSYQVLLIAIRDDCCEVDSIEACRTIVKQRSDEHWGGFPAR